MKRNTSNWSNFGMLLRRAGLTVSAGLLTATYVQHQLYITASLNTVHGLALTSWFSDQTKALAVPCCILSSCIRQQIRSYMRQYRQSVALFWLTPRTAKNIAQLHKSTTHKFPPIWPGLGPYCPIRSAMRHHSVYTMRLTSSYDGQWTEYIYRKCQTIGPTSKLLHYIASLSDKTKNVKSLTVSQQKIDFLKFNVLIPVKH